MTSIRYLRFDRLDHPIALEDAARIVPMIADVFAKWPHVDCPRTDVTPFAILRPHSARSWSLSLADTLDDPKQWGDVNVVCELVAEVAWERLRSSPELLCLHAAAVDFGGRLVVMPNARRAGKSTLAVALARLGHRLFTDDFLPVQIDPSSLIFNGEANGILPRLRLPLPQEFSLEFRDWVIANQGPSNKQYKFLAGCPIAQGGTRLPLGAVIVLDRQETACNPTLQPINREDALASLITQNFARTEHASRILSLTDRLTNLLPAFKLTYHCAEAAAAFLSQHAALQDLPVARHLEQTEATPNAPLANEHKPSLLLDPSRQYVRAAGVTETKVGNDHFLADTTGAAIHRLNAGSALIWQILSDPVDLAELVDVVSSIFETVDREQILSDTQGLMQNLVRSGLVSPVPSQTQGQ